MNKNFKIFNWF